MHVEILLGVAFGLVFGAIGAWLLLRRSSAPDLLEPVRESLNRFDTHVRELESSRQYAYGELRQQVRGLAESQERLRSETGRLASALRAPTVRGRWGEVQLRRVVELAGMVEHCDFLEQPTLDGEDGRQRPDMVVTLPGGRRIVVDAKAPLHHYLEALEAEDPGERRDGLREHARQVRAHIARLSAKSYWSRFDDAPEFVVLFLPGEAFFSAALEQDPDLIEAGADDRVILATPTTLIALLRSVAFGWRQEQVADNARAVSELGRELHGRLVTLAGHLDGVGKNLDRAVRGYNDAVGSLESRVLVSARRFSELGAVGDEELEEPTRVVSMTRTVQVPELADGAPVDGEHVDGDPADGEPEARAG